METITRIEKHDMTCEISVRKNVVFVGTVLRDTWMTNHTERNTILTIATVTDSAACYTKNARAAHARIRSWKLFTCVTHN